jgi:hypothetical protein
VGVFRRWNYILLRIQLRGLNYFLLCIQLLNGVKKYVKWDGFNNCFKVAMHKILEFITLPKTVVLKPFGQLQSFSHLHVSTRYFSSEYFPVGWGGNKNYKPNLHYLVIIARFINRLFKRC